MNNSKWRMRFWLSLFSIFVLRYQADAQQRRTLQETIRLSIKNSKQLLLNQARIEEANATTMQAYEAKLPQASASGTYLFLNNPTVDLKIKMPSSGSGTGTSAGTTKVNQLMYATVNAALPIY